MRLLPNKEKALKTAEDLEAALKSYCENTKIPSRLNIYSIVFLHSFRPFLLFFIIFLLLWGLTVFKFGLFDLFSLSLLFPIIVLVASLVKHTVKWTKEFVLEE